jgi:hypothetical protein
MTMGKQAWIYLVVGGLLIWWWFGVRVHATITVPEDEIRVRLPTRARPGDALTLEPADSVAYDLLNYG